MKRGDTLSDKMATLSAIWESYAQLIRRRTDKQAGQKLQQCQFVLDKFLGLFIMISLENKEDNCVGEMRNIGNELSQEFMRNVHTITRNLNEEEATKSLEEYMLKGRGWRLLYTVDRVGVKSVSQRHDLCEVLINLLPYCLHMNPKDASDIVSQEQAISGEPSVDKLQEWLNEIYYIKQPLSSCFLLVSKSSKLKQLGCPSLNTRKIRRVESDQSQLNLIKKDRSRGKSRERKTKKRLTRGTPSKKQAQLKKSETEEEVISTNVSEFGDSERLDDRKFKQPRFKRGMRAHMWSPFLKDDDSETDDEFVGSVIGVDNNNMSITGLHLAQILVKLLLSLGELDMNQNVRGRTLSATILPSLLYFLSQFRPKHSSHPEGSEEGQSDNKWINPQKKSFAKENVSSQSENYICLENAAKDSPAAMDNRKETEDASRGFEEDIESVPWEGSQRILLLRQVVRAVLTLSSIVATQQNGVKILMHLKVVEHLLDLKIVDSLIPGSYGGDSTNSSQSCEQDTVTIEAAVSMDMVCGLMQLLQAVYTSLPFNPSNIYDANSMTSKLMRPDIIIRINRLISYSEIRIHQFEKIPSPPNKTVINSYSENVSTLTNTSEVTINNDSEISDVLESSNNEITNNFNDKINTIPLIVNTDNLSHSSDCDINSITECKTLVENINTSIPDESAVRSPCTADYKINAHKDGNSEILVIHDASADPIRCIGALITTLKGVKVNYIHSLKCLKRRHRNCEYGMHYDHHHDILGSPHYVSSNLFYHNEADFEQSHSTGHRNQTPKSSLDFSLSPSTCVVSKLATVLLDYISEAKFKASRIHLLSTLRSVGVCCCLQPESVISAIVPHLPMFSHAVRSYSMDTLTLMMLDHFQGAQESREVIKLSGGNFSNLKTTDKSKSDNFDDSNRCVHCYLDGSSPLLAGLPTAMDSGFSSCDIEEMRKQKLLERWKSLRLLQKSVISRDENLAFICAKHLMTLAIRGNSEIKEELFFGIYLHVLFMKVFMPRRCSVQYRQSYLGGILGDKENRVTRPDLVASDTLLSVDSQPPATSDFHSVSNPTSLLNSQESLVDSLIMNSSQTTADSFSGEESFTSGSVSSSIMLLCVSALPYVLQVDKVMSIFLARKGLAKLTDLLEYEQLRAPVMSVFEALIMIDEHRLKDNLSDHRSVYEAGGVIQTFIDTLAKRTCTVTATLQQISLQKSKEKKAQSSPTVLTENEFLKLYKDSVANTNSPSDTNTTDYNAQESKTDCSSSMVETLPVLLDMWKTCAKLCMNSRMFRAYYRESPCLYVVQETLVLALSLLGEMGESRRWSVDNTEIFSQVIAALASTGSTNVPFSRSCSIESRRVSFSYSVDGSAPNDGNDDPEEDSNVLFSHEAKLEFIEAVMMVCFSCHTISPSQKRGQEDELWLRLNSALKSCIHLEASKLASVFHMLLNVALPRCPSILEYSYSQILSMLNLREREDIADEDEVKKLLQHGFEDVGDAAFTEHGYDGDSECSVCFDWKKGLEFSLENQAMANTGSSSWPCFPAVFRLFVELMITCHRVASRGVILHTVALRLLQTLRSSKRAVQAFCSEHLLEVLVDGFKEILVHCPANGKQSTLQEIILSLVQTAAHSEISASELKQFLRMFQNNTETTNSLLSTLLTIIEKTNVCPSYYAAFPVKIVLPIEPPTGTSETSGKSPNVPTEQAVYWHTAVELDVPSISWPPNPTGFTVAIWMCLDDFQIFSKREGDRKTGNARNNKPYSGTENFERMFTAGHRLFLTECLLVFAIGNKEKMFEVWVHPKSASVYCRLTSGLYDVGVLKDCNFEHLLTPNTWHLLTFTYSESLDGSTFMGKLIILLDGWQKHTAILDHSASMRRRKKHHGPILCVGDAYYGATKFHCGSWKLGTLRLFRDVGLSDDWWFRLYCLGPNYEGMSKCDCGDLHVCYTPAMQKRLAGATNLTWDVLVGVSQLSDMDAARVAQVLVYKINQPEQYAVFTASHMPVDSTHSDLGLVPSSGSVSDLLTQKPVIMSTRLRGRVKVREVNILEKAIEQAGGIQAFLFLVAKVFEDSMKAVSINTSSLETAEYLQSKAIHILFQLVHKFPTLSQDFCDANGYAMLAKVLTSSQSIVGYQLLKVLLDACTTESVFKTSQKSACPVFLNHPEAVIRDTDILSQILLHWRIWHKAGDDVTAMLFGALEALVNPAHPYHAFNLKQMQAGGVINKIFSIYLERIQDGQPSLSVKVSQSASKVIKGLLGSPPDFHLLMNVMDFLLLVHPAASGFISFTPSSFYFKLRWESSRSRASSTSQDTRRVIHTMSDSSGLRPNKVTDNGSKIVRKLDPNESSDSQSLSKAKPQASSNSLTDSHDDENTYQYPPLKVSNIGTEKSRNIVDSHDECDNDCTIQASFYVPGDVNQSTDVVLPVRPADNTNSFDQSEDAGSNQSHKNKQTVKIKNSNSDVKRVRIKRDSSCVDDDDDTKDEGGSQRDTVMYFGSDVSDKQSDLDGDNGSHAAGYSSQNEEAEIDEDEEVPIDTNKLKAAAAYLFGLHNEEEDEEHGLTILCVSLIEYLTQVVQEFPEASLDVFSKVVNPKSLLVLAKNSSSEMRLAVIKLLGAYLSKAPSNLIDAFIKMDGFYLLANQLRSFPVICQHVEGAMSILLGHEFAFNDNFMVDDLGDLTPVQQAAPVLLLSMLDNTASNTELCRNSLMLLSQLLETNSTMSNLLLDIGLAETMCNLATNIQRLMSSRATAEEEEQNKALLIDVQLVLCSAAVREFGWSGPIHFQNVEDLFILLRSLEDIETNRDTEASKKRAGTARAFQVSLVVKILEYVEKCSEELVMTANMGWLTASSVSASSYNKPRQPLGRHNTSQSFSTHSSSSTHVNTKETALPSKAQSVANLKMRRTTFSSPDFMGFLAETYDDKSAANTHLDGDSSGSVRPMPAARPDTGIRPSRFGSLFNRKRKVIYASLSQSDLLDRFKKIIVIAVDLAIMFPREEQMRPVEQRTLNFLKEPRVASLEDRYLKHLFLSVYRFFEQSLNKEFSTKKYKNPTMHGAKEQLRMQFTRLLLCMMSLKVHFDLRTFALAFIMTEPYGKDAILNIITDKQVGTELSFYLYNLLASWKDWLNPTDREYGFALMLILRNAGYSIGSPDSMLTQAQVNGLMEDKRQIDIKYRKELAAWLQKREVGTVRINNKFESVRRRIAEQAMSVTQDVTRLQVEERKKLVTLIKRSMTTQIQLKKQWQELVQNLTHERAVWYQKESYPQSWQMDPTEGPGRVRKRMQRCHLGLDKRYLLPSYQQKLEAEKVDPPLLFLFEDDHQMSDSAALIYRLYTNEKIQHTCKCTVVSPASESKGELLVGEVCIFFVADGAITVANYTQILLGNLDQLSITLPHTDIRELHKRWYQLQDVGLEIFLISGRTCLLAFQTTQDRDQLYNILRSSLELPNLIAGESLQAVQHAWLEGEVTNYDYLMYLNKLAGRSYTDLMQYPVFPFILKNYHDGVLDLNHMQEYRNLRKPIAVQAKTREKRYKDNYEFLCQEACRPHSEDEMIRVAPFHYGSHYSNSGTVLHYMLRVPPFTTMFLSYQDNNFDIPDRTFHSLGTSWRLSSFDSSTDVKELIPEFFFLPEIFINSEGFDFGLRQNGERVNHVSLAPWCDNNSRLFVLIHRQALESAIVTRQLHHWVDLVFGYKQQGEEAVKAINVFHPSTYFGVDASGIKDNVKRQALLTMIRTYGQTPKQLFRSPHPMNQARSLNVEEKQRFYTTKPVATVTGLRWGNYVGSLDLPPPVSLEIGRASSIKKLVAVRTGLVFGVEKNANILLLHGKQRDLAVRSVDVMWAGVVTWGYHDNIIRIRSYQDKPLINFLPQQPACGKISCVESVPDCRLLFTAGSSGIINVYSMTHNSSKPSNLQVRGIKKTLYGHSGAITTLCVCQEFSILVSGSTDGTCIIWDLNRLTYVRSIISHCAAIHTLTVSSTLGDIASVSLLDKNRSCLQLHTVNASHVATQEVHSTIHCLGYSCAPEGRSVNVVAGGLGSGAIRLWSSWDLAPLRDLVKDYTPLNPVISLTFSSDSQYLMAVASDGSITLWDKDKNSRRYNAEKFIAVIVTGDGEK